MSGKFLNIFSTRPKSLIKDPLNVVVDYREKSSLVIPKLLKLGCQVEIKELKVADYITQNVAIERKTISDFLSSMTNKRLLRQLEELQQFPLKLLIIEGLDEQDLYNDEEEGINGNAIRGFLLSITLKHKVPIIFSKNAEDTAKFIYLLAKKKETPLSLRPSKKNLNKREMQQYLLEGFPGIGPKMSKKLLKHFKTLENIFNAPIDDLKEVIGKKAETFEIIKKKF